MPRKKKDKDNLISLAEKTNDASFYTTRDLIDELAKSDVPDGFKKCVIIVEDEEKHGDGATHKFNYFVAGYKSRFELLGVIEYIKNLVVDELNFG